MKRWMVRGKLNIGYIKKDKYWLKNIQGRGWVDGQYLYYQRGTFDEDQDATLFKSQRSAKGKVTKEKDCLWVEDIEVVEVQILIPGEKNEV